MMPRLSKALPAVLAILLVLAACFSARAFTVHLLGGNLLRWPANKAGPELRASVPFQDWLAAVNRAAGHWSRLAPTAPTFRIKAAGRIPPPKLDGLSTLGLADQDQSRLSRTQVWYRPSSGAILEVDVRLNSRLAWQAQGSESARRPDVEAVLVSELGHCLGLGRGGGLLTGLWPKALGSGEPGREDLDGLSFLYPSGYKGSQRER